MPGRSRPGAALPDAPLADGWLLSRLGGGFRLLAIDAAVPDRLDVDGVEVTGVSLSAGDNASGALAARFLGEAASAVYLIRPDQHVAARWTAYDEAAVAGAVRRAIGKGRD